MTIRMIGFGYTKNLGNYENCKLYMEVELEDWEDASETLNWLRGQVAEELNLPDKWFDLKGKFSRQLQALEVINAAIREAQEKCLKAEKRWGRYAAFLAAHGVDPRLLVINSHPDSIAEAAKIALELDAVQDIPPSNEDSTSRETTLFVGNEYDGCFDDEDGDDSDPYYGDEYDRLHNEPDSEIENLYF